MMWGASPVVQWWRLCTLTAGGVYSALVVELRSHISHSKKKSERKKWRVCSWNCKLSSVIQLCLTLCNHMNCSTPGLPVHHQLPESTQTHVRWVGDAIQPSHPLSSPFPPALNLSQHQGFFKWVSSLHQVAKVLEFQLQHQSFQWTLRTDHL